MKFNFFILFYYIFLFDHMRITNEILVAAYIDDVTGCVMHHFYDF